MESLEKILDMSFMPSIGSSKARDNIVLEFGLYSLIHPYSGMLPPPGEMRPLTGYDINDSFMNAEPAVEPIRPYEQVRPFEQTSPMERAYSLPSMEVQLHVHDNADGYFGQLIPFEDSGKSKRYSNGNGILNGYETAMAEYHATVCDIQPHSFLDTAFQRKQKQWDDEERQRMLDDLRKIF